LLIYLVFPYFAYTKARNMKTIQSYLIGRVPITARDKHVRLFQVRQVLNRHREQLIDRLLNDIPYFLARKYQAYATPNEIEIIKTKLGSLKAKDVDLNTYEPLIEEIKRHSSVTIKNDIFLQEIDQLIIG
jgi:hypothetical protein